MHNTARGAGIVDEVDIPPRVDAHIMGLPIDRSLQGKASVAGGVERDARTTCARCTHGVLGIAASVGAHRVGEDIRRRLAMDGVRHRCGKQRQQHSLECRDRAEMLTAKDAHTVPHSPSSSRRSEPSYRHAPCEAGSPKAAMRNPSRASARERASGADETNTR
jgi:hypothetical protein